MKHAAHSKGSRFLRVTSLDHHPTPSPFYGRRGLLSAGLWWDRQTWWERQQTLRFSNFALSRKSLEGADTHIYNLRLKVDVFCVRRRYVFCIMIFFSSRKENVNPTVGQFTFPLSRVEIVICCTIVISPVPIVNKVQKKGVPRNQLKLDKIHVCSQPEAGWKRRSFCRQKMPKKGREGKKYTMAVHQQGSNKECGFKCTLYPLSSRNPISGLEIHRES